MAKVCRCLLQEMDDQDFWRQVQDYLETLPQGARTDTAEYERRLGLCKECANLVNGFCSLCGCVVELRAAKRIMHCPNPPPLW